MTSYIVVVHEEDEAGAGWAEVEELPGCFASALRSRHLRRCEDFIEQHISALQELGQAIPEGKGPIGDGARRWLVAIG
jgi:predicted RNase H-like HicB family nuclease